MGSALRVVHQPSPMPVCDEYKIKLVSACRPLKKEKNMRDGTLLSPPR